MIRSHFKRKYLLALGAAYMVVHGAGILFFAPAGLKFSYPFLVTTPFLAALACLRQAWVSGPRMRLAWSTLASGFGLWSAGMFVSALQYWAQREIPTLASLSDFLFFAYCIPMLLVIISPMEAQRSPMFVWLDAAQAVCAGCLLYVLLFSALPFDGQPAKPVSMPFVVTTENIENLLLAIFATIRLLLHEKSRNEGRMYRMLATYLWVYAVLAAVNNYFMPKLGDQTGLLDLVGDPPFLLMVVLILSPKTKLAAVPRFVQTRRVALYIDNASHIISTVTLLLLGGINVRTHFALGMFSIGLALAVYAVRSTLLQNRYLRSEHSLRVAHAQLKALSFEDGLTGVANRRSFDAALAREWHAAIRTGKPLSLLLIDLDFFKSLNDRRGHLAGDQCLTDVAQALEAVVTRSTDLLARYGGEEFAALLVDTDRRGAELVAKRMMEAVAALRIENPSSIGQYATISVGVATHGITRTGTPTELIDAADRALYGAKQAGRNQVGYWELGEDKQLALA